MKPPEESDSAIAHVLRSGNKLHRFVVVGIVDGSTVSLRDEDSDAVVYVDLAVYRHFRNELQRYMRADSRDVIGLIVEATLRHYRIEWRVTGRA